MVSLTPRLLRAIIVPSKTWMRSLSPSLIFTWTRMVSPGRKLGRSLFMNLASNFSSAGFSIVVFLGSAKPLPANRAVCGPRLCRSFLDVDERGLPRQTSHPCFAGSPLGQVLCASHNFLEKIGAHTRRFLSRGVLAPPADLRMVATEQHVRDFPAPEFS